jgi:hypothetical protein
MDFSIANGLKCSYLLECGLEKVTSSLNLRFLSKIETVSHTPKDSCEESVSNLQPKAVAQ